MAGVRKNLSANIYATATSMIGQIAVVPLFVRCWGGLYYGQWLVIFAIPSYLTLGDFGMVEVLGNKLTIAVERNQLDRARSMFGAVWFFQGLIATVLFLAAVAFVTMVPLQRLLSVTVIGGGEFVAVILLLAFYSLASAQACLFGAIYRAARVYPRYLFVMGHLRLVEMMVVIFALLSQCSMTGVAGLLAATRLALLLGLYLDSRRLLPEARLSWRGGTWRDFRTLLPSGAQFFAFPVGYAMINQGVTLIVNSAGGAYSVVVVSVCRQVSRAFIQGAAVLFQSIHPELTTAFARDDLARMRRLQSGALVVVSAASAVFVMGSALIGPWVVHVWTGSIEVDWMLMTWFALESTTVAIGNVARVVPWAVGRMGTLTVAFVASNCAALLGCWLLFARMGPTAVPLPFVLANVIFAIIATQRSLVVLDCRLVELWRSAGAAMEELVVLGRSWKYRIAR